MKNTAILFLVLLLGSCIPISIAPNIKEDKIKIGKRFKRHLPKQYALIFKDPKDADEFYHFINSKFSLNHESVEDNVPFKIKEKEFAFSFYEVEKTTKTINILPMFLDAALDTTDDPIFEDAYSSRTGHWYIVLLASDSDMNDCLNPKHKDKEDVIKYLRDLRKEYLSTENYKEAMLKENMKKESISID